MDGKSPPQEPIRMPPLGLIVRKSSDRFAVKHEGVARNLRFISKHYHEPIGVDDLAGVAAMSLRGFHQAFLEHVGWPPGQKLHRVRIERAKQLLASSSEKTETVGKMCGYQNANSFWVAFRKATGLSPKHTAKSSAALPRFECRWIGVGPTHFFQVCLHDSQIDAPPQNRYSYCSPRTGSKATHTDDTEMSAEYRCRGRLKLGILGICEYTINTERDRDGRAQSD